MQLFLSWICFFAVEVVAYCLKLHQRPRYRHPLSASLDCIWRHRDFGVFRCLKRIACRSLSLLAKRRLYLIFMSIGGWRLSQIRRSLQNTNTEVNKPIQIQNSLAKGATCAACIDMDRSFLPPAKAYCRWADRTRRYVVSCFDVNGLLKVDQHWGVARAIPPARLRITSA